MSVHEFNVYGMCICEDCFIEIPKDFPTQVWDETKYKYRYTVYVYNVVDQSYRNIAIIDKLLSFSYDVWDFTVKLNFLPLNNLKNKITLKHNFFSEQSVMK